MRTDRWTRICDIVTTAGKSEPVERRAYLQSSCGDDESLRREVEILLDADAEFVTVFGQPPSEDGGSILSKEGLFAQSTKGKSKKESA